MIAEFKRIESSFLPDDHSYMIGDNGEVRNGDTGKTLKTMLSSSSAKTPSVVLYTGKNQYTTVSVRRLVAEAFLGPPPENAGIVHLDGDPSNVAVGNLLWVSRVRQAPRASVLRAEAQERPRLNRRDLKFLWRLFQTYPDKRFDELERMLTVTKKDLSLQYEPMYTQEELKKAAKAVLEQFS